MNQKKKKKNDSNACIVILDFDESFQYVKVSEYPFKENKNTLTNIQVFIIYSFL